MKQSRSVEEMAMCWVMLLIIMSQSSVGRSLFVLLVDRSLHVELVVLVGLADVQEEVVVRPQKVKNLVCDEQKQAVDCVSMHAVGCFEALLFPYSHLVVEQFICLFL